MRRVVVACALVSLLAACGGGDDDTAEDPAVTEAAASESEAPATEAPATDDSLAPAESAVPAEDGAPATEAAEPVASGGGVAAGPDTDICALFTPEELAAVVGMPLEEGAPFFSGQDENSCDWTTPSSSEVIGTVSIRLAGVASFVLIDATPYPLSGLGDSAEVENKYGQTNVHYGDWVVTFQVNGAPAELADIAAAYPDLAAEPDAALVSTADSQSSVALAQAFASRFTG